MRIALLAPFSPFLEHSHAASDTLNELVPRLAKAHDLTVLVPGGTQAEVLSAERVGCQLLFLTPPTGGKIRASLGTRPGWLRQSWSQDTQASALRCLSEVQPDVVHCEYLQTAEVAMSTETPSLLTMHDVTTSVMRRSLSEAQGLHKIYRAAEFERTRRFETAAASGSDLLVTLSALDAQLFRSVNPNVWHIPPGVGIPQVPWSPPSTPYPVVVFTGAMWRKANEAAVVRLLTKIMPRVWEEIPNARVRIVGSEPSLEVRGFSQDPRIEVTGRVPSIDDAIRGATVVACPTAFGGGVLMKILRALALGAPVVSDAESSASLQADNDVLMACDSDAIFGNSLVKALLDPALTMRLGTSARAFVEKNHNWDLVIDRYSSAYASLAQETRIS